MDGEHRKELRDYAWKYFSLHADQRIKTFNFYILLCGLGATVITTTVKDIGNQFAASVMSFGLALISLVFWKLDVRNKELIKTSEAALKYLEELDDLPVENEIPNRLNIFRREEHDTIQRRTGVHKQGKGPHFSYSMCFNILFAVFGAASLAFGIICLFNIGSTKTVPGKVSPDTTSEVSSKKSTSLSD